MHLVRLTVYLLILSFIGVYGIPQLILPRETIIPVYYQMVREWEYDATRVWRIDFSADAQRLAIVKISEPIEIWNVIDGRMLNTIPVDTQELYSLDWHPTDNRYFVTADTSGHIRLWNSDTLETVCDFAGPPPTMIGGVLTADWSPDGSFIVSTGFGDNVIRLLDSPTLLNCDQAPIIVEIRPEIDPLMSIPAVLGITNHQLITTILGEELSVWDTSTGKLVAELPCWFPDDTLRPCRFLFADWDRDGRPIIAIGGSGINLEFVRYWDVQHRLMADRLSVCDDKVSYLEWTPQGRLWASCENDIHLLDPYSFQPVNILSFPPDYQERGNLSGRKAISPNDRQIIVSYWNHNRSTGGIQVWGIPEGG